MEEDILDSVSDSELGESGVELVQTTETVAEQDSDVVAYLDYCLSANLLLLFGVYLILGVLLVRFFLEKVRG